MENGVEGRRRPAVVIFREEDARAVSCRALEHRRVNRTGPRERAALRFSGESCKGVALCGETAFDLLKVLRKKQLPVKLDTVEAGRLARGKDDVSLE